ncbi:MAG TPA: hypothetical protein P5338_03210 [Bacteroidales bacterium]|nr:hypothetical protein [Bacteroidales bacterium]
MKRLQFHITRKNDGGFTATFSRYLVVAMTAAGCMVSTDLNAQFVNISIKVNPETELYSRPDLFSFSIQKGSQFPGPHLEGTLTMMISATENQQIQVRYPQTLELVSRTGAIQPLDATFCYNNQQTQRTETDSFSQIPCTAETQKPVENFSMHHIPLLIERLPGNPSMLFTWLSFTLKTPLPGNKSEEYCTNFQIQIEYN